MLGAMKRYEQFLRSDAIVPIHFSEVDANKAREILQNNLNHKHMGEVETRPLLEAYGIPLTPAGLAKDQHEAGKIAVQIGYPLVMKIVSRDILHKSDAGGIRLNLQSIDEVKEAFTDIMQTVRKNKPGATVDGILLERMVPKGQEVIVGVKLDATFGPMLMMGMGGIYVELLKDVAFRIAPVTRDEIRQMILETYAGQLMQGFRGQPAMDVEAVVEVVGRIAQLALDFPMISELEINPLIVYEAGKGVIAVDSRAILD